MAGCNGEEQQGCSMPLPARELFPQALSSASANCSFDGTGILVLPISPSSTPYRAGRQQDLWQLLASPWLVHKASSLPRQQSPPNPASHHEPKLAVILLSRGVL